LHSAVGWACRVESNPRTDMGDAPFRHLVRNCSCTTISQSLDYIEGNTPMTRPTLVALLSLAAGSTSLGGPYPSFSDPAGYVLPNQIRAWATGVEEYAPAPGVDAASSNPARGLGPTDGQLVALGDLDAAQIAAD